MNADLSSIYTCNKVSNQLFTRNVVKDKSLQVMEGVE